VTTFRAGIGAGGPGSISISAQPSIRTEMFRVASPREVNTAWQITTRLLQRFKAVALEHGATPVVVILPRREQVLARLWKDFVPAGEMEMYSPSVPARRLAEICARNGVLFVDALP